MIDFEKLGVFYFGRPYDIERRAPGDGLILYDSRDLVTHAVCVGMTGSGKTGLCIDLIEEAALDGVPAIVIDPKGDVSNLLLTFPDLRPEDFAPWVNADEARSRGLSVEAYAGEQAQLWRDGLAQWGQNGERIRRLRASAEFAIYTPGSTAGLTVSILKSFAAPAAEILSDAEMLGERVATAAASLLTLIGVEADAMRSREHILLSTVLDHAWRNGRDLDLATLIEQVQSPPIGRVGVMDLDSFYPSKERFELAMRLNNLLAAPGFSTWLDGEPLEMGRILHTHTGKPRVAIFSIAHLNDGERMFFVSLLLNQLLGWMRTQSGTSSLRAILYIDEILGYMPPVANPSSKTPLLTLLKQARAFGVGVVLATQNPVDLDYKGLANAGTWFIGRLQTERDKARLIEGLEGVAAGTKGGFDRKAVDRVIGALTKRIFLLHNVHEDGPIVFETRWAMSYLRGPLTREQIRILMAPQKAETVEAAGVETEAPPVATSAPTTAPAPATAAAAPLPPTHARPVLPPDVPQYFVPVRARVDRLVYEPMLFASAIVQFADAKRAVDVRREVNLLVPFQPGPAPLNFDSATEADFSTADLETEPEERPALFTDPIAPALRAKSYETWAKEVGRWLYQSQTLTLWRNSSLGRVSTPGETERDFRVRLQEAAREMRDAEIERLRKRFTPKKVALEERLRRAEQAVARESGEAQQQRVQTAISVGATLLGALVGRKAVGYTTVGRATTAARGVSRSMREAQDIARARETVSALRAQLDDLEAQLKAEIDGASGSDPLTEELETLTIRPKRTGISVRSTALVWAPAREEANGTLVPAW